MSERDIKVTDRRIFTSEGELREEFRFLDERADEAAEKGAEAPPAATATATAAPPAAEPPPPGPAPPARSAGAGDAGPVRPPGPEPPPLEIPATPSELGAPSFYDLVAVLAEPVALYLGDAELPDGGSMEDLDMARVHIDLLDVLRQKSAGNLSAQELATLEDVLYRLRMRYVQKRG